MGLFDRTRMCLQCRGLGKVIVHHSKTYRETAHCYACDGAGRVKLMADGRPEPGFGWGVGTSVPPPPKHQLLPGTAIPDS
jgi:hypothetical protein